MVAGMVVVVAAAGTVVVSLWKSNRQRWVQGRGRGGDRGRGIGDNTKVVGQPPRRASKYIYFIIAYKI